MIIHKCDMCGREIRSLVVVHAYTMDAENNLPVAEYNDLRRYMGSRDLCRNCFVQSYRIPAFTDRNEADTDTLNGPPF